MELILRFTRLDRDAPFDAPVPVTVHFAGSDSETVDFRNPLADADLTDLRWYIERYPLWPVGPDYDRAEALQARLPRLGRALFDAVFDRSATAMRLWERFDGRRDGAEPATVVVDTTEPRILRLPWELLADEGGYLFSKQPPVHVRRRMHRSRDLRVRPFQPPVRLLMVISRPAGAGFIDPRSSAAPLLDQDVDPLVLQRVVGPESLASHMFALIRDRPEFARSTPKLRMFDTAGNVVDADVTWVRRIVPGPEPQCGYFVEPGDPVRMPLDGPLLPAEWTAELNYLANTEGSLTVSLPVGPETKVAIKPGLNRVYVRLSGAGDTVIVRADTAALAVCLASGPVGYLAPR